MFKFGTIGAYKQVRNNPRCVAQSDMLDGMVILINDEALEASVPGEDGVTTAAWIVGNIIDKPEVLNKADFKVLEGEHVRAFYLPDLKEMPIEICNRVVTDYDAVEVDDILVAGEDGKWVVTDDATGYAVSLHVQAITTYGDYGFRCRVIA